MSSPRSACDRTVPPRPRLATMRNDAEHCSFVLLADFDIDRGALLTYQFPQPLGTDEGYVLDPALTHALTDKLHAG